MDLPLTIPGIPVKGMTRETGFGCVFSVYRQKTSPNVVSVSLWKETVGYSMSLANGLLWWNGNLTRLFPGFNLRVYFDATVFTQFIDPEARSQDVDWRRVLRKLYANPNVELWLYRCMWGTRGPGKGKIHKGTFGSMVRFHALFDPSVQISVIRNIELLSSVYDAELTKKWIDSGDAFHIYTTSLYGCAAGRGPYWDICHKAGLDNRRMLFAGFISSKATLGDREFRLIQEIMRKVGHDFTYGIDEVILTIALVDSRIMNDRNTNITLLEPIGRIIQTGAKQNERALFHELLMRMDEIEADCADPSRLYILYMRRLREGFEYLSQNPFNEDAKPVIDLLRTLKQSDFTCRKLQEIVINYYWKQGMVEVRKDRAYFLSMYHQVNSGIKGRFFHDGSQSLSVTGVKDRLKFIAAMQIVSTWPLSFPGQYHKAKTAKISVRQLTQMKKAFREDILKKKEKHGERWLLHERADLLRN
jgi:hypothetical protein